MEDNYKNRLSFIDRLLLFLGVKTAQPLNNGGQSGQPGADTQNQVKEAPVTGSPAPLQKTGSVVPAPGTPYILPEEQRPINNGFWFALSRTWVTGTDQQIQSQATNIQTTVRWVFGLSTSGTVVGIFVKNPQLTFGNAIWFGMVILFLMTSFALSIMATSNSSMTIKVPNDAVKIREAFNDKVDEAKRYLIASSICMFLGMALIAPALVFAFNAPKPDIELAGSIVSEIKKTEEQLKPVPGASTTNQPKKIIATNILKSIQVSGRLTTAQVVSLRLDSGKSAAEGKSFLSIRHNLRHPEFDIIYPFSSEVKIPPGDQIYLTIFYHIEKDTALSKTILLNPIK